MAIRYPAYLEIGPRGRAAAFVFRLPGLFVEAVTPAAALALLPAAVTAEYAWLARHGARPPEADEPVEVFEAERIDVATDVARGEWRGLFDYELRATRDADVELARARTALARADLLALLDLAGADVAAALAPRLLAHAEAEWELMSKLGSRLTGGLPEEPPARLTAVRERAEARLRSLLPGDRERLAVFAGEKWTARKVLRCYAVGERRLLAEVTRAVGGAPPQSPR